MTTTPPVPAAQAIKTQQRMTLRKVFDSQKPELAKLLPRGMDPERLVRMALTECVKNPALLECTAESWALAIQTCAAQGLYPDSGLGYMYLIPRGKVVTAQRGYQGDIKLARNSGEIADIYAEVVYAKDHYKVTLGLNRNIEHVPHDGDDDPGPLRACYAVAKLKSGEVAFVTLTKRDVERHMESSQTKGRDDGPWKKHTAAMWKKTAIHELYKWLPKESEAAERVARAIAEDQPPAAGPAIEAEAINLGDVELPSEKVGGLDGVTERLKAADQVADATEATACEHPNEKLKTDASGNIACTACGEVVATDKGPADEPPPALGGEAPRTGRRSVKD